MTVKELKEELNKIEDENLVVRIFSESNVSYLDIEYVEVFDETDGTKMKLTVLKLLK